MRPSQNSDRPKSHVPSTSRGTKDVPHCFGQRGLRCPLLRPDPAERPRLTQIRDNLIERITEAQARQWLGEVEGLKVSLAGAQAKLAQMDQIAARRATAVNLGIPTFTQAAGRDITASHR